MVLGILKDAKMRFRVDYTPYECEICLSFPDVLLKKAEEELGNCPDEKQQALLQTEVRKQLKKSNNKRIHLKQVALCLRFHNL